MKQKKTFTEDELRYLRLLATKYPTVQDASTEIINLQAILSLPKGTEHFISDIHGEYEAFLHILNSCSGHVKEKMDELFSITISKHDRNELATLIYYPEEKLAMLSRSDEDMDEWYQITLYRLLALCRWVATKYTRNKVRKALPKAYEAIVDELIQLRPDDPDKEDYYENIIKSIIQTGQANGVIKSVCQTIKRLTVDHLHIVGDIFDRGPRADVVMDSLLDYHSVDIQWGNHDILWMGAACGSRTMVATVLANSIHYNNLDVIETGYGISLRPLSIFANEVYKDCDTHRFTVKLTGSDAGQYTEKDKLLSARMHKAITVILFKLEGQKIKRHPEYEMDDRLLLDKIDYASKTINISGTSYPLEDCDFPTVDPKNPYELTPEEKTVIEQLTASFRHSEKLQKHARFLYAKGGLYKIHNGSLLFHGCIPMTAEGKLQTFNIGGQERSGRAFLDYAETTARKAMYQKSGTADMDFLWWLWAGRNSPIFGRDRMTTFERRLIADESAWTEAKNAYYTFYNDPDVCQMLLQEFGLTGPHSHIINGHVPVKVGKGESPIKGGGRLIVIDGGFCKAYQPTSGIAGYTLVSNSHCIKIVAHQPFAGKQDAILHNHDIANDATVIDVMERRVKIAQTDQGKCLQKQVDELQSLLDAYRSGAIREQHKE